MHTKTLTAIGVLLVGVAACNNPKPAGPVVTTPAAETTVVPESAMPGNEVNTTLEPTNSVAEPAAGGVRGGPSDEPRGTPDRRSVTPSDGNAEPK